MLAPGLAPKDSYGRAPWQAQNTLDHLHQRMLYHRWVRLLRVSTIKLHTA